MLSKLYSIRGRIRGHIRVLRKKSMSPAQHNAALARSYAMHELLSGMSIDDLRRFKDLWAGDPRSDGFVLRKAASFMLQEAYHERYKDLEQDELIYQLVHAECIEAEDAIRALLPDHYDWVEEVE